jgi:hypothetical protein
MAACVWRSGKERQAIFYTLADDGADLAYLRDETAVNEVVMTLVRADYLRMFLDVGHRGVP